MVMALRVASTLSKSLRASRTPSASAWRSVSRVQQPAVARFSTKYTEAHEYIKVNGSEGTIGITDFAQNQLGDVVYVELPSVGQTYAKGDAFGSVESVKAASDVYVPASGTVIAVNEELTENPNLVNDEAMTAGWFIKINIENPSELDELMDEAAYKEFVANEDH